MKIPECTYVTDVGPLGPMTGVEFQELEVVYRFGKWHIPLYRRPGSLSLHS